MGVALFRCDDLRQRLVELKNFRNSFAHGSGLLSDLPKAMGIAIADRQHAGVRLEVVADQWVGNARSAAYYLLRAERAVKQFQDAVFEKYLDDHHSFPGKD